MQLTVSFHPTSPWRVRSAGVFCLAAGLIAALAIACAGWVTHAEKSRFESDLSTLRGSNWGSAAVPDESALPEVGIELQAANQIIARLNTPWPALFRSLEAVYSENAILLGVEPDPLARSIRLTAESKDATGMLEFVRQLRAEKVFADAYIASHAINESDMQRPIRFSVSSRWLDVPIGEVAEGKSTEEGGANRGVAPTVQNAEKPEGET